jgi:phage tail tube protein FII
MEAETAEINGAGLLGSYNTPNKGHYGPMTTTLNFFNASADLKSWYSGLYKRLDIRAVEQDRDEISGELGVIGLKYLVAGTVMNNSRGNIEPGALMDGSITIETLIFGVWQNNVELQFYDKINYIHRVNGVDILAEERALLGG